LIFQASLANLLSEVTAMRRTCFVCYGADGKKNSLTYHEISRKNEGDEFFLFFSRRRPEDELPLRELYRRVVSSSRLGHPARFFRELAESAGNSSAEDSDDSWMDETGLLIIWRKGDEAFVFRNSSIEAVHFDSGTGREGPIESLAGRTAIPLRSDGTQGDLFDKKYWERFILERFNISENGHTLLFAPSRDFVRRNREALLDSVLFPSFEIPEGGELDVDTDYSLGAMHWGSAVATAEPPERKKRGVEIMKASAPMAAGAVALILAILLIFKPFGGNGEKGGDSEEILLSPAGNTDAGAGTAEEDIAGTAAQPAETAPSGDHEESVPVKIEIADGWKKKFDAAVTSSPVICGDNVTFGCRDGNLYCFSLDGSIKWKYAASTGVGATPACTGDMVVGADYEGNVFCLGLDDGARTWNYKAGAKIVSSPVVRGSTVIVCTMDGRIIALDLASGERKWGQKIGSQIWATPAIGKDFIVAASTDGSLVRLSHDGKVVWRVAPGGKLHSSPICIEDMDLIVLGTGDRYVIAYSLSGGMLMWRYGAGSDVRGGPSYSDGRIYAGTEDGLIIALDTDGQLIWSKDLGGAIRSKPLTLDDMIAVTAYNSKLSLLSASDGSIIAEYPAGSPVYSSPAYYDGRIFFGSNGGFFYAPVLSGTQG
jgi:outer membrane protein assembly factor BamB